MDKTIILLGPTAVGKTEVSLLLAERIGGEIISADAFQVYRGMDIGTAKPTPADLLRVPHHLIDILEISEEYSAARFRSMALSLIEDIKSRAAIPLVVGGSGLYIKALVDGLFDSPPADPEYRELLRQEEELNGPGFLHAMLLEKDPAAAARIHPHNIKRVIRALEVLKLTGIPISQWQQQWRRDSEKSKEGGGEREICSGSIPYSPLPTPYLLFGLRRDREDLYDRINRRVLDMFNDGLVEETRRLLENGLMDNPVARQVLGYKEIRGYLDGEYNREEAVKRLSTNTRRFAKRQLTWWRGDDRIEWVDLAKSDRSEEAADRIREKISAFR